MKEKRTKKEERKKNFEKRQEVQEFISTMKNEKVKSLKEKLDRKREIKLAKKEIKKIKNLTK